MIVITTDHAAHDPDRFTTPGDARPYWEIPARADALLAALRAGGTGLLSVFVILAVLGAAAVALGLVGRITGHLVD